MEHTLTGTPLDALQAVYLDLTAKLGARLVGIDDALRELQAHEVVDAAGRTWRIDPITRSFISLSPEPGAVWRPADPSEYVEETPAHRVSTPRTVPDLPQGVPQATPATQYMVPVAGAAAGRPAAPVAAASQPKGSTASPRPPTRDAREGGKVPTLSYALAGAVGLILAVVLAFSLVTPDDSPSKETDGAPAGGPAPAKAGKRGAPAAAHANAVPSADRYHAVLDEIISGDVDRVSAVIMKSQYGANGRRMYTATYAGWISDGLTIGQNRPTGDASGTRATQTWELRRGNDVIATANVTWQRVGHGWRLAGWPEFRPAD